MASYSIRIRGLKTTDGTVSVKVLTELLPDPQQVPFVGVVQASKEKVDVAEFWGQWPGDESIEELLAGL